MTTALKRAMGGGVAGAAAMGIQVSALMVGNGRVIAVLGTNLTVSSILPDVLAVCSG